MEIIEVWKDIVGYPDYKVSNLGSIKSKYKHKKNKHDGNGMYFKTLVEDNDGYLTVSINSKTKKVHRLVAEAFIPNPCNYKEVNHIDGNKHNNCVHNLEWCSHYQNMKHANKTGLISRKKGEENKCNKSIVAVKDKQVLIFYSVKEASNKMRINSSAIVNCLKGRTKTCKGFRWFYRHE